MNTKIKCACVVGLASIVPALAFADQYVVRDAVVVPAQPVAREVVVQPVAPPPAYVVQPGTTVVQPQVAPADSQVILVAPAAPAVAPDVVYYRTRPLEPNYRDARIACESLTGFDRDACTNRVNRMSSGEDAKCEKLSGFELENCLLGADHGQ